MPNKQTLGVGFIGSGFIARFHLLSWQAVRDADVLGVYSPNREHAEGAAGYARSLHLGDTRAYSSITDMVADPAIDCIWITGPNHKRIENMEEIVHALKSGKGELVGIACEKPLARNASEAQRMVELVQEAGVLHAYLEDQLFTPGLERGRQIVWARGA
ncbi:MAG TPA: Gfo/Idh/MocA family oxidoreductase, partial [Rhodothermales bacterium]|nr:Gfo/Idh/MocA family oxidoreductase [Rhodothermales bacterium]